MTPHAAALLICACIGANALAADAPPGIAVVEAFVRDDVAGGSRTGSIADALAREHAPGVFTLVYRIATGVADHDRFAARRGTIVRRAHEADAGDRAALVVDGAALADDASESDVRGAVARSLAAAPRVTPSVRCQWYGDVMWIGVAVPGAPDGAIVTVAVIEDGLAAIPGATVPAHGPTDAVVRTYKTVPASPMLTDVDLSLPAGMERERSSVVAVAYDAHGSVIGAARCSPGK